MPRAGGSGTIQSRQVADPPEGLWTASSCPGYASCVAGRGRTASHGAGPDSCPKTSGLRQGSCTRGRTGDLPSTTLDRSLVPQQARGDLRGRRRAANVPAATVSETRHASNRFRGRHGFRIGPDAISKVAGKTWRREEVKAFGLDCNLRNVQIESFHVSRARHWLICTQVAESALSQHECWIHAPVRACSDRRGHSHDSFPAGKPKGRSWSIMQADTAGRRSRQRAPASASRRATPAS